MTKPKKKDSLVWLEELVEAAKAWRATFPIEEARATDKHGYNGRALAVAVDGYGQAIKDEVEAELEDEEKELKKNG